MILLRDNIPSCRLQSMENDHFEALWVLLRQPRKPREISHIILGVVYYPPGNDNWQLSQYLLKCLDQVSKLHQNAKVVLTGDFNHFPDSLITSFPLNKLLNQQQEKHPIWRKFTRTLRIGTTNLSSCHPWGNRITILCCSFHHKVMQQFLALINS